MAKDSQQPTAKKLGSKAQKNSKSQKPTKSAPKKKAGSLYKKSAVRQESDSEGEDDDEEDGIIDLNKKNTEGMQNFTFEFSDVSEKHANSLSTLFKPLVDNSTSGYELADVICLQEEVGTVIHCEGDDDLFALATSVKISMIEKTTYFQSLAKVLKSLESNATLSKTKSFQEISSLFLSSSSSSSLTKDNTAFYIYSRFLNLPLILSYELQRNLYEDLAWVKDEKNKSQLDAGVYESFSAAKNLLLVRPLDQSLNGVANEEVLGSNNLLTHFFEDDVFLSHATHAFVTGTVSPLVGAQLLFMVVPYESFPKILKDIKKLVE